MSLLLRALGATVPPTSEPPTTEPGTGVLGDVTGDEAVDVVLTQPAITLLIVLGTFVIVRLARRLLHRLVRRVADKAASSQSTWWRARVPRLFGESPELAEKRRRQRIDATSRMLGHLVAVVAWATAFVIILHVWDVDLLPVLTGAGFIGAGLAIGGQHAVKDFIAGIGILVEDRYGVGDHIEIDNGTLKIAGVVEHVGALSTRVSDGTSTWHVSNGGSPHVRNLSQNPVVTALEVPLPPVGDDEADVVAADAVAQALQQAAGDRSLTGVILVDDVRTMVRETPDGEPVMAVEVRTSQPLTGTQTTRLERVVTDELWRLHHAHAAEEESDSEGGDPD
jgi:small conductance mechanosensitive channel